MYDWLVPLRKLNSDPSPATARSIQVLLKTYNAAPARTTSTGAMNKTMPVQMALEVLKLLSSALIQGMSHRVWLTGAIKLCLNMVDAVS